MDAQNEVGHEGTAHTSFGPDPLDFHVSVKPYQQVEAIQQSRIVREEVDMKEDPRWCES